MKDGALRKATRPFLWWNYLEIVRFVLIALTRPRGDSLDSGARYARLPSTRNDIPEFNSVIILEAVSVPPPRCHPERAKRVERVSLLISRKLKSSFNAIKIHGCNVTLPRQARNDRGVGYAIILEVPLPSVTFGDSFPPQGEEAKGRWVRRVNILEIV